MSNYQRDPYVVAVEKGLRVVLPAPDELFIDIDDAPSLALFVRNNARFAKAGLIKDYATTPSPSGASDRFHITVKLTRPVADKFERIMLQALLGSDRIHEALSWVAAIGGNESPTVFFEKPIPVE